MDLLPSHVQLFSIDGLSASFPLPRFPPTKSCPAQVRLADAAKAVLLMLSKVKDAAVLEAAAAMQVGAGTTYR